MLDTLRGFASVARMTRAVFQGKHVALDLVNVVLRQAALG